MILVDDLSFKKEVLEYEGIVLVDFYADWCGPCRSFSPIFNEFSNENCDVKCVKVDVDKTTIAKNYKVMNIPTILLFKNGEMLDRFVGVMQKRDLGEFVNKHR